MKKGGERKGGKITISPIPLSHYLGQMLVDNIRLISILHCLFLENREHGEKEERQQVECIVEEEGVEVRRK